MGRTKEGEGEGGYLSRGKGAPPKKGKSGVFGKEEIGSNRSLEGKNFALAEKRRLARSEAIA